MTCVENCPVWYAYFPLWECVNLQYPVLQVCVSAMLLNIETEWISVVIPVFNSSLQNINNSPAFLDIGGSRHSLTIKIVTSSKFLYLSRLLRWLPIAPAGCLQMLYKTEYLPLLKGWMRKQIRKDFLCHQWKKISVNEPYP